MPCRADVNMEKLYKNMNLCVVNCFSAFIIWIYPAVSVTDRLFSDSVVSLHFTDIGNYISILDHPLYGQVLKKTQTWLDYDEATDVKTCALKTSFEFSLDLHERFVKESFLNVSCPDIKDWIRQNWITNSGNLQMCWKGRKNDHCILAVAVDPPERCGGDNDPLVKYYGHTQKDMAIFEELSFCGEDESGLVSVMGHLRDHLSCAVGTGTENYVIRMAIVVAAYGANSSCLPSPDMRDGILRALEGSHPKKRSMVELSTQLVDRCPNDLSCRDKTCYKTTDRCNFQLECLGGEDEGRCWCDIPDQDSVSKETKQINSIGPSTLTENGFRCDFELVGTGIHDYCAFCPWGHGNFKLVTARNDISPFPLTDATERSKEGHFMLASFNIIKEGGYSPHLISTCLGSTGPDCVLRFHYVVFGETNGKESINVIRTPTCEELPGERKDVRLETLKNFDGVKWNSVTIHIGEHTSPFRLAVIGDLIDSTSIIAIDGLELQNCRPDLDSLRTCKKEEEFQCKTHKCINRDRMCNLVEDCICGEDEKHEDCERIPHYGRSNFENCKLDDESCWWYNAEENHDFKWTLERHGPKHYVNANTANRKRSDGAVLKSIFYPPPRNANDGECKVRFFHHKSGNDVYKLDLWLKEEHSEAINIQRIKFENYESNQWNYETVVIPNVTQRYQLQFKAIVGFRPKGNISVSSITLSPECFNTPSIEFESCGATGHTVPTQAMCDMTYRGEKNVHIKTQEPYYGAQSWQVPNSAIYSITAMGGSGGLGARSTVGRIPYGTLIHAQFNLTEGEKLFFVIGQEGESACQPQKEYKAGHICTSKSNITNSSMLEGGGGGGGGATFVFKVDEEAGKPELLLVAGGGGGMGARSHLIDRPLDNAHGSGRRGLPVPRGDRAGGGIGWLATSEGFATTMVGGSPCLKSQMADFNAHGGYGGGGGGCTAGGGGGGYTGGNAGVKDTEEYSGMAGTSYVSPSAIQNKAHHNQQDLGRRGNGFVDVLQMRNCPCDYYCVWEGKEATSYKCLCPSSDILAEDGTSCIAKSKSTDPSLVANDQAVSSELNIGVIIAIATACTIVAVMMGTTCLCVCRGGGFSKDCEGGGFRFDRLMSYCKLKKIRTQRVRQTTQRPNAVIEFNPNYDFIGAKHPQQLPDINRRHLQLVRALGQGAFGEVYKGLLSHVPHVEGRLPVAVKTLPAVSTDQTELDFQMEAIIVSKFNHPNIVKFLGVCFEARPRFIVLELLEGGDLKSFLRESRPKPSEPSSLTVMDLLKLAGDVARGCQHLEEKHFIHRDIAARNCLLTSTGPERQAKIADFGMARDIYRSDYYKKAGNALLPVKWMPPEAFLDGIFTTKTDIWSFGILLWEIFSLGYMPYPGCSNEEVMHFVTVGGRLEAPDSCPSSVYDIMASCWSGLAEERPPFSLILTSLEKCMQDEDITSKGLRILYLPKLSVARGFKLPAKAMGPSSGDRSVGHNPSEGYLEPLLPSWITEDLPDPRLTNDDDLDEENRSKSKSNSDTANSPKTNIHPNTVSDNCRLPTPEIPLLSVEDFQILFEGDSSHSHEERQ